ncbi:LysR family transcriptional regulator [Domibacillus epiphyticus]|uniref:LysR family transcriptional regulator n=1 Tax=Domibacillus epiphyticus TaxID=1714355 RepID=A0A1V2A5T2_9BACI|nr:LysR family transcriptional regulator [Domibacillus epiphyticus]OMP66222.1 LysR family transcriptional regulator [Domibacillus epiphyticus]
MSSFSEFRLLTVLAEEMNMRKAAERLFVTQPALSQRLQTIEKEWEVRIFNRSTKGLSLTPAGELIVAYAKETLEKKERLLEELQLLEPQVHGTLKIACATIVGQNWLPKVLKLFVERYPHAKIQLVTGWSSEILKALYEGDVHIGIIRGTPEWKGRKIHLFEDPLFLVDKDIQDVEELLSTEKPFIQFKSDSNYDQEIQEWWHNRFQMAPKRSIVVDQIETCRQMAFNGLGYAILPAITLSNQENDLYMTPILDRDGEPISRDTWLLGYDAAFELRQVQAFVETVDRFMEYSNENRL